jgi:hypothetical protein
MNCLHYRNESTDFIRNQTEPNAELSAHLLKCAACRDYMESQKQLYIAIQSIKKIDAQKTPAPLVREKLLTAIRNRDQSPASSFFWMKAAAVFIISVLCGSLWIYQKEHRQDPGEKTKPSAESQYGNGYVPLTYGMAPGESLQRVRVKLPRSALNDFGIALKQTRSQEVTADVLMGESGVPYAIRVVQQTK